MNNNVILIVVLSPLIMYAGGDYMLGCYYDHYATQRHEKGKDTLRNYVPGLCTHIIFAYAGMDDLFNIEPTIPEDTSTVEIPLGMYQMVNHYKKQQPGLKTIISFGGYWYSTVYKARLKKMISTFDTRQKFTKSAIEFTKKYNFDGFNIHWQYPERNDKESFAALIKEMGPIFTKEKMILSATVSSNLQDIDASYNVREMAEHVNFVEVRTIDMHGFWEPFTGFNSPLYDRNGDHLSISTAANYWTSKGMPKNKIMLSLATFGRSFVLVKPENHGVGAGSTTDPNPGRYTKSEGLLSFFEICEYLESDTAVCYDDKQQGVPYAINGNKWVGYDNTYSLAAKVEWLKHNKFGGVIVFSLDLDDYIGLCGWSKGEKYPLIRTLHTSLYGNSSVALNQKLKEPKCCPGDGLHPDTTNCRNYYYNCRLLSCGDCLVFNSDRNICDFPERYSCKNPDTNV